MQIDDWNQMATKALLADAERAVALTQHVTASRGWLGSEAPPILMDKGYRHWGIDGRISFIDAQPRYRLFFCRIVSGLSFRPALTFTGHSVAIHTPYLFR